jgi:ArsR family transcriptional regulator, arsenate/arsenite/antimonite-responsive transcriptional repressor
MTSMDRTTINIFRALDDPNRLRILKMLEGRELCVCEVREVLDLSTSTVSKHLTILRDAGLILDRKDGKWVNFKLNSAADGLVRSLLGVLKTGLADEKQIAQDREKVKHVDRTKLCSL